MSEVNLHETTDAVAWAAEFVRIKKEQGWTLDQIDKALMIGWFANAMCAQMDADAAKVEEARKRDPSDLRELGWSVAVHNDYRQDGESHTFWLFTKASLAVRGEGRTDAEALDIVREKVRAIEGSKRG